MKRAYSVRLLTALLLLAAMATAERALGSEEGRSIEYEMKVQRASEAAIWGLPAVSIYDIEMSIQRDLGGTFGDVVYFSKPMDSRHGFLTANDVTPYVASA